MEDIKLAANLDPNQITTEDLLFFLYDLAGEGADHLINLVSTLKSQTIQDGKRHEARVPLPNEKKGFTLVSFPPPTSYEQLRTCGYDLEAVARTHKYMSQADEWMLLASVEGSPVSFDIFGYIKDPWQEDPQIDQIIKQFKVPGIPVNPDGTRLSKNQSCPCGSGEKFKRCHGRSTPER